MLPAAYQVPAAIALVVGGAVACFFGYRLFRVVLSIFGFILGGLMASSLVGPSDTTWMIGSWIVGGVIGMALLYAGYYVGVALSGAALGATVSHLAFSAGGQDPPFLIVLVFWLTITFMSFGLQAPANATVLAVLLLCALSVAGAVFLIQEMDGRFDGLIQVSADPLRYALTRLGL